ncbi:hypothetical protein D3C75_784380 [compost metagenome]
MYSESFQETLEITGPTAANRRSRNSIFEYQIPAKDPGQQFAKRDIAVSISAPGYRKCRGEL